MPEEILTKPTDNKSAFVAFTIVLLIGLVSLAIYFLLNNKKVVTPQTITNKSKNIITVKLTNQSKNLSSYNIETKEQKDFFQLPTKLPLNEMAISPDGNKIHYLTNSDRMIPSKNITIINKDLSVKDYQIAENDNWSLQFGILSYGGYERSCHWSPDSKNLACSLYEIKNNNEGETGKLKIVIVDIESGKVNEVFTSNQTAPLQNRSNLTQLIGWINNNEVLIIQSKDDIIEIEPSDFYRLNINSKSLVKEYSSPVGKVAIAKTTNELFFGSPSRTKDDKLIKYNLITKEPTILSTLYSELYNPIVSSNETKVVYTTMLPLKSIEEIATGGPNLKGSFNEELHIYDLKTKNDEVIKIGEPINEILDFIQEKNKAITQSISKLNTNSYDVITKTSEEIEGTYIGLGNF